MEPRASESQHSALISLQNELGRFVAEEHALQRETMRRLWASPQEERVEEVRCIADARITGQTGPKRWVLECGGNDSRFREGDLVRLSRGDPQLAFMEAMILAISDTRVEVQEWRALGERPATLGEKGICLDESFIDLEDRYRSAIEDLGRTAVGRDVILPLLQGGLRPTIDTNDFDDAFDRAEGDGLNDKQKEAVANAVASDVCWLIQGPPGTGKTHVLAWIIVDLLKRGERVLVTSFTHRAINNLLTAVAERLEGGGHVAKIAAFLEPSLPAAIEQREKFSDLSFVKLASGAGYVIGATPFALRSHRLGGRDFDTVVIDEASQVTVPLAIMAMLAGKRYIFAGDHRQLPPVTLSRSPAEAKSLSIFGRLVGRGYDTMLTITHRLNEELCRWPSDTFYLSRLRAHPRSAGRSLRLSTCAPEWREAIGPTPSAVWLAIPHQGCRSVAPEEATLIAAVLHSLHAGGLAWQDMGVVLPFRRQARYLRRCLAARSPDRMPPAALVADTVERMQGQEREVVLVSFTTSDEDFAWRLQDFLFLQQRLNVAATRPRTKLLLVASPVLLTFAAARPDHDGLACFASLLRAAHRIDVPLPGT
jgi:DNA replication ATP-dependent helicase Dna2